MRKLSPKITVEINNVDPTVEKDEIVAKIAGKLEIANNEIVIKSLKTSFSGNARVIVEIPASAKGKLGDKIMLGFTNCNIKLATNLTRCCRCHGFGHIAYGCTEVKAGKEVCRKCGKEGHNIKDCVNESKCRLCIKQGLSEEKVKHVAGALSCPQYKTYLYRTKSGTASPSA